MRDLAETMYAAPGIGLAATQVDVHQRIIVIDISDTHDQLHVLINPEIITHSGESDYEEGCLSVPGVFGKVLRAEQVTVEALNRDPLSANTWENQGISGSGSEAVTAFRRVNSHIFDENHFCRHAVVCRPCS